VPGCSNHYSKPVGAAAAPRPPRSCPFAIAMTQLVALVITALVALLAVQPVLGYTAYLVSMGTPCATKPDLSIHDANECAKAAGVLGVTYTGPIKIYETAPGAQGCSVQISRKDNSKNLVYAQASARANPRTESCVWHAHASCTHLGFVTLAARSPRPACVRREGKGEAIDRGLAAHPDTDGTARLLARPVRARCRRMRKPSAARVRAGTTCPTPTPQCMQCVSRRSATLAAGRWPLAGARCAPGAVRCVCGVRCAVCAVCTPGGPVPSPWSRT